MTPLFQRQLVQVVFSRFSAHEKTTPTQTLRFAFQTPSSSWWFHPPTKKKNVYIYIYKSNTIMSHHFPSFPQVSERNFQKNSWNSYLEMILFDVEIFETSISSSYVFFVSQQPRVHQRGRSSCELATTDPSDPKFPSSTGNLEPKIEKRRTRWNPPHKSTCMYVCIYIYIYTCV